jgi:hypothetical protein
MPNESQSPSELIQLSPYTQALLDSLRAIRPKPRPDDFTKITVSQTVSLLAIVYEKVRNAVEYREDHLLRRAAIERILKRRLSLNPSGKDEAENIARELLWARYVPNGSIDDDDIRRMQDKLDGYANVRRILLQKRDARSKEYLYEFMMDMLTCEIEESLNPDEVQKDMNLTFFIYQTLRRKIKIDGVQDQQKDIFFLAALENAFRKSDKPYKRYHIFQTFYKPLSKTTPQELSLLIPKLALIFRKIDSIIADPNVEKLTKFTRKQLPPFNILFDIVRKNFRTIKTVLTNEERLHAEVINNCNEKYKSIGNKVRNIAVKSIIYILVTKTLFAVILEYPVSMAIFGEVHPLAIAINALFPPMLMLLIIFMFRFPGKDNTERIFQRIVEIIDRDNTFETKTALIARKLKPKNSILIFIFTIIYSMTFIITLLIIYQVLTLLDFNIISQTVFLFFVSMVTFFAYRIKQVINEYTLVEKHGILTPFVDFFFMPILSIGKFLSTEIGKLNFFIVIFDFIIEAPFKLIIDIFEEWISFTKARKDEIM